MWREFNIGFLRKTSMAQVHDREIKFRAVDVHSIQNWLFFFAYENTRTWNIFQNIHLMIKKKSGKTKEYFTISEKPKKCHANRHWRKKTSDREKTSGIFFCWWSFWWSRKRPEFFVEVDVEVLNISKNSKYGNTWSKKMWKKVNYFLQFRKIQQGRHFSQCTKKYFHTWRIFSRSGFFTIPEKSSENAWSKRSEKNQLFFTISEENTEERNFFPIHGNYFHTWKCFSRSEFFTISEKSSENTWSNKVVKNQLCFTILKKYNKI